MNRSAFRFFLIALIILVTFLMCRVQVPVAQAKANNIVPVQLSDIDGQPITRVLLRAWRIDNPKPQSSSYTNKDGIALLKMPPGRYYFTCNISKLKRKAAYATSIKTYDEMGLYYISSPMDIAQKAEKIAITIDNVNYIDVADIGGIKGLKFDLRQKELGIQTPIYVGNQYKWIRLYLPTHLTYTIQDIDGVIHMKWPFYADPGLQFIISSPQ